MSNLAILKRGVATITDADVGTFKDIALPAPVKTGSSFLKATVRDRRRNTSVQRGTISITDADVGNFKDSAALTAVDMTCSEVRLLGFLEKRDPTGQYHGALVALQSATAVRASWGGTIAAGETLSVGFEVVEHKSRRGATIRLLDEDTVRIEWDLQLVAGETITLSYEVVDLDEIGDMLLEAQFRAQRILGELGINMIQDLLVRDEMRNLTQYRVRTFLTKADALAAVEGIPDGSPLEDGEISRRTVSVDVDVRTNDRTFLISVLDSVLDTPDLTPEEE